MSPCTVTVTFSLLSPLNGKLLWQCRYIRHLPVLREGMEAETPLKGKLPNTEAAGASGLKPYPLSVTFSPTGGKVQIGRAHV